MNKKETIIAIGAAILAVFVVYLMTLGGGEEKVSGVTVGNEYESVAFAGDTLYGATTTDPLLLKTGWGSVGSYVITGANTGIVNFYDATTTDATLRASKYSTSTILIASVPASAAAGTYTFDAVFNNGLIVDVVGTYPTSTLNYR